MEENSDSEEQLSVQQELSEQVSRIEQGMASHLSAFIAFRYVRTLSCVYSYLKQFDEKKADEAMSVINSELKQEILDLSSQIDPKSPEVFAEAAHILEISDFNTSDIFDRVHTIAQNSRESVYKQIFDSVRERNPLLSMIIEDSVFVFSDIVKLDDRAVQKVLREVDSKCLAIAVIGAEDKTVEKILKNMSRRAGIMLREDSEYHERRLGDSKQQKIEDARLEICQTIRRLEDAGEVIIDR